MIEVTTAVLLAMGGIPVVLFALFGWLGQRTLKDLELRQKGAIDAQLKILELQQKAAIDAQLKNLELQQKGAIDAQLKNLELRQKAAIDELLLTQKTRLDAFGAVSQHISKSQFDQESEIYRKLWNSIMDLDHAAAEVTNHKQNEPGAHSYDAKCKILLEARSKLLDEWKRTNPFCAPSVYELIRELVKLVDKQRKRDDQLRDEEGNRAGMIHADIVRSDIHILEMREGIANAIRERLSNQILT